MKKRVFASFIAVAVLCTVLYFTGTKREVQNVSTDVEHKGYIIIDAGHGGFDGGAVASDGTIEKDLNLDIALKLDAVLRAIGYRTVLTRCDDSSTDDDSLKSNKAKDMKKRLEMMKNYPDAIFVSIHMNKYTSSQPNGAQVFYSKYGNSKILADCIQNSIATNIQNNNRRVTKQGGKDIYLLYNATVPAVITECGFISNPAELLNLKNETYRREIATAIAFGIIDYNKALSD